MGEEQLPDRACDGGGEVARPMCLRVWVHLALALLFCLSARAGEGTIPGARLPGAKAHLGDPEALCAVVPEKKALRLPLELPLGRVRLEVRIRTNQKGGALRQRGVSLAYGKARTVATVETLERGTFLALSLVNRGRQVAPVLSLAAMTAAMEIEFAQLQARDVQAGVLEDAGHAAEGLGLREDSAGETGFDARSRHLPVILVESIRVVPLSGPVIVTACVSDRITYAPDSEARLSFTFENLADTPVAVSWAADMLTGLVARTPCGKGTLDLGGGESETQHVRCALGPAPWGRGFEVRVDSPGGSDTVAHAVSVITNPWMVAMHGRGWGMSGSERYTREEALAAAEGLAQKNMREYNNIYEKLAWAPCDYSEMTPDDDEPFYSGQTQYCNTRSSLQTLHEVFEAHGIASITYGKSCASGLPGLHYALRHPERMNVFGTSGFAHESIDVDIIDRMFEGRYRQHGRHEDFWQMWISCWTHFGNHAAVNYGCDEIARSARLLGWDGVRYDGHWWVWKDPVGTAQLTAYAEKRIAEQVPGVVFGYNTCGPRHNERAGAFTDVEMAAMARGGGLVISEYYRNLTGAVQTNIAHLQNVGDFVRLHGGYPLAIFDKNTPWNAALVMAAGFRPMGGGGMRKFATRYSQYIFDPALRRLTTPERFVRPVETLPFRWDAFVYERVVSAERHQLILQLVNVSDETVIGGQYTEPKNLNPPQRAVSFELALPEGYKAGRVFACGDPIACRPMMATFNGTRLTVSSVDVWTLVVIDLERRGTAESLFAQCPDAIDFSKARDHDRDTGRAAPERAELRIAAAVGPAETKAINLGRVRVTPTVLDKVLAAGLPEDTAPGEEVYAKADMAGRIAGRDAGWRKQVNPAIRLVRNGVPDIHCARGVFSHRNRLGEAMARIPQAVVSASCLRSAAGMKGLSADNRGVVHPWPTRSRLTEHDVLILDSLPAPALSIEQRRDVLDFVRGGGGLFVLGGWYSLSKGDYEGSFLEEVLPVRCKQIAYLRRLRPEDGVLRWTPAGREWARGVALPDSASVEWVNHVEPKAGAAVLMMAGDAPVLIAGRCGKGQALVWAASHSGTPQTPWWESRWWPAVAARALADLGAGSDAVAPPDRALQKRVADAIATLEAGELAEDDAVTRDRPKTLRLILSLGTEPGVRFVAGYLLSHPDAIEPKDVPWFTDSILSHVEATPPWATIAQAHLGNPPVGCSTLVAEIAATALEAISYQTVMKWRDVDDITRLRCLGATGDAAALGYLRQRNAALDAREARWQKLLDEGASHDHVSGMYATRLVRPYVTWALLQCGQRDEKTLYQFAKACLDLPYYHWRQHWVLRNKRTMAQELVRQGSSPREGDAQVRFCETAIRRMKRSMVLTAPRFRPAVLGTDEMALRAAAKALAAADCHKSLPLALAFLREVPDAQLPFLAALRTAKLASLRHAYTARDRSEVE